MRGQISACLLLTVLLVLPGCWKTADRPEQPSDTNQGTASRSAPESQESSPEPSPGVGEATGRSDVPAENSTSLSAEQIYRRAEGSLTLVKARGLEASRVGSGFAVGGGSVVTNEHVVADASKITVEPTASRGTGPAAARLVADRPAVDLALLRSEIDMEGLPLGKFEAVTVGQPVFVVSNPKGLEATFSEGIVSSIRSRNGNTVLQITAPVSEGSSGGPVLNEEGKVVGVVFAVREGGQNLNFAVPVSYVRKLLRRAR
jgi:serine protease Do